MKQDPGSRLWIAEAEYSRHLVRCLLGRAPMRDATLALERDARGPCLMQRPSPFLVIARIGVTPACNGQQCRSARHWSELPG